MRTEDTDGASERRFLIQAITNGDFLARISGRLPKEPLRSKWSNVILGWCQKHYTKYRRAPGKKIDSLLELWAKSNGDKDTTKLISRFLASLSGEYEGLSDSEVDFAVDEAERLLNDIAAERLEEEIRRNRSKDGNQAQVAIANFRPIELKSDNFVDLFKDKAAQKQAFEDKQKILIKYQGPAEGFFGTEFSEDSFIGVMASAKGGKSYFLLDAAWRAMRQGRRVAYFQVGDLSKGQIMRRFYRRAAYRPFEAKTVRLPLGIVLPMGQKELAIVDYEDKVFDEPMTIEQGMGAFLRVGKKYKGEIRLSHHPIKTIGVDGIRNILESWDRNGWKANVVVIDYAYNLAAVDVKANFIDQVGHTWAMLRQLSEIRKCCVITANQSNKEGFKTWVLTRNNFADSKMILAHVTAFIGVNTTDEEKANGVVRYNFIVRREDEFNETKCLYCASCLALANPIVVSTLPT